MRHQEEAAQAIPKWTVGDRLRKARESAGLHQADLADLIDVSRRSISAYELGESAPRRPVLLSWALATDVPLEWLQTGAVPPITAPYPTPSLSAVGHRAPVRGATLIARELVPAA